MFMEVDNQISFGFLSTVPIKTFCPTDVEMFTFNKGEDE
jgi:hypothetical protein